MDKTEFMSQVRQERTRMFALLAQADGSDYTASDVAGHWTLKDVIAHIASNSFQHYRDHIKDISTWIQARQHSI